MQNVAIAFPNFLMPTVSYTPTVAVPAGSGWLDLGKLTGDVLSEMARCPSVDTATTKMVWDMGTTRAVRVLAMPVHNCTIGDQVRVQLAVDADFTDVVADTGWQPVIDRWYEFGALPFGDHRWWDGMPSAEDLDGYCPPWRYIFPDDVFCRYVKWEWDVSTNPAGYLDVGRLSVGPMIQPRYNLSYGVKFGWVDRSQVVRSRAGAVFGDPVEKFRTASIQLDWLSVEEAFGQVFELQRRAGVTEPFMFIYNGDDGPALMTQRSFMARFASIKEISHPRFSQHTVQMDLEEYK